MKCSGWHALCEVFVIDSSASKWWSDKYEQDLNYHSYGMYTDLIVPTEYNLITNNQTCIFNEFGPVWNQKNSIEVYNCSGLQIDKFSFDDLMSQNLLFEPDNLDYAKDLLFRREEGKGAMSLEIPIEKQYSRKDLFFSVKFLNGDYAIVSKVGNKWCAENKPWENTGIRSVGSWVWMDGPSISTNHL